MNEQIKILLIDDSDLVAKIVSNSLEEAGMIVIRGCNGVEGVELTYKEIPDVIIMDAEMPLMPGYLASRLLKNQRGVCDIPIIMHTSLSEDKDKYWAKASGADEFVEKNFDAIDNLIKLIHALNNLKKINKEVIKEDAQNISKDSIFEMLGSVLDQQLFQTTITNSMAQISQTMDSLESTSIQILNLLQKVCETNISIILLKYNKTVYPFISPSHKLSKADLTDFLRICLNEFHTYFPSLNLQNIEEIVEHDTSNTPKRQILEQKISSCISFPLKGCGDIVIGTLHIGNYANNYFSEKIIQNLNVTIQQAGTIIDNAVLFNQTSDMHDKIRSAFSKYVPIEIIDDLIENQKNDMYSVGEKRVVTILFADIRNFTTISENNRAEDIVTFLNNYFNVMVGVIKKHGGTIDKFIGDAILAVFGAPTSYKDNSSRAVHAAEEMLSSLSLVDINISLKSNEKIKIGIGIHEGEAIIGNIGSKDKFDYTVIGDTVNLASRLEGLTKFYHESILISETVKNNCGNEFALREIDSVRVMGKETSANIFCVMNKNIELNVDFLSAYSKALKMYRMGNWTTSIEYLHKALTFIPDDGPTQILLERCLRYEKNPPIHWDGIETIGFK